MEHSICSQMGHCSSHVPHDSTYRTATKPPVVRGARFCPPCRSLYEIVYVAHGHPLGHNRQTVVEDANAKSGDEVLVAHIACSGGLHRQGARSEEDVRAHVQRITCKAISDTNAVGIRCRCEIRIATSWCSHLPRRARPPGAMTDPTADSSSNGIHLPTMGESSSQFANTHRPTGVPSCRRCYSVDARDVLDDEQREHSPVDGCENGSDLGQNNGQDDDQIEL